MARLQRYKDTIINHGLRDYDVEKVRYVMDSSSPQDAIRRVEKVYKLAEINNTKISYFFHRYEIQN